MTGYRVSLEQLEAYAQQLKKEKKDMSDDTNDPIEPALHFWFKMTGIRFRQRLARHQDGSVDYEHLVLTISSAVQNPERINSALSDMCEAGLIGEGEKPASYWVEPRY